MVSDKLKKQAKQAKVSLTYMRGGKRYKKTEKMLSRQLKKGGSNTTYNVAADHYGYGDLKEEMRI